MKRYTMLSILFLVGCTSLSQQTEIQEEPPQVFSGVWQNTSPNEGTISYPIGWTLTAEETTDTGYLYSMNIDDGIVFSFYTKKEISAKDIIPWRFQNTNIDIPDISLEVWWDYQYNPLRNTQYAFRANFSGDAEIICSNEGDNEGISFPNGSGELFVKWYFSPDMTYPYINHFPFESKISMIDSIFPGERSPSFNWNDNPTNWGMDDCLVEIGDMNTITKNLPVHFSGFDNYIFAITKEKSATSHCRELVSYDYNLLFYNQEMFCKVRMNASSKIKDIQLLVPILVS